MIKFKQNHINTYVSDMEIGDTGIVISNEHKNIIGHRILRIDNGIVDLDDNTLLTTENTGYSFDIIAVQLCDFILTEY